MGLRVGCAVGVVLTLCAVARPGHAQLVYYNPNPTAVDVWLTSSVPNAQLQIYQANQRPGHIPPAVACIDHCAFKLLPGDYRVLIEGPPDSDVHKSLGQFELVRPSKITVDPPSALAHYGGLAMGIVGPIAALVGAGLLIEGGFAGGSSHSVSMTSGGAALVLGGIGMSVGGWVLFGTTRHPHVEVTSLPPPR